MTERGSDVCGICGKVFTEQAIGNAEFDEELQCWTHITCWRMRRGLPPGWHRLAHAIDRAKERYGFAPTIDEVRSLEAAISEGYGERIGDASVRGRAFYNVLLRCEEVTVVYDEHSRKIATFLSPDMVFALRRKHAQRRSARRKAAREARRRKIDERVRRRNDSRPSMLPCENEWERDR